MTLLLALMALAVIVATGVAWTSLLVPQGAPARAALVAGSGILLGQLLVPLIMRALDALGIGLSLPAILVASLGCVAAGVAVSRRLRSARSCGLQVSAQRPDCATLLSLPALIVLALIALRFVSLGLELSWRPLFPFDATMHWATKSRVWFEHAQILPFVPNSAWLEMGGAGVYTDHHPDYPRTVPLLQVWMCLATGQWNESLMNLPWLLCYAGLGLAFYAFGRAAGVARLTALVFTWMVLSMPLLNAHIALAGYADGLLGSCYCAAIMALHCWTRGRNTRWAVLAAAFGLGCLLFKNEGLFWLTTLVAGLVVAVLPWRRGLLLLAAASLVPLVVIFTLPSDLVIAGHSLETLAIRFRPDAAMGLAYSLWVHDNWHLLGYLLVLLVPAAAWLARPALGEMRGVAVSLLSALLLVLFLYLFTRHYLGAVRFSSLGRISLHLAPAMMFFCMLLYSAIDARLRSPATAGAANGNAADTTA